MKKVLVALLAAFWMTSMAALPASAAVPELPHAFFGEVRINGAPAPVGTRIEARGNGVLAGIVGNPITTTLQGVYGGEAIFDPKLVVQGTIAQGASLSFLVNGNAANETATWLSGQVTRLDLTVTTGVGGGGGGGGGTSGGGGGATGTGSTTVTLSGVSGTSPTLDNRGKTTTATKLTTTDGKVAINISTGTQMADRAGLAITTFTAAPSATPPTPPLQGSIVLAYQFGPTGAKFNPPISMSLTFNPATVPAGVPLDKLFMAFWDGAKWMKLTSTVDPATNTITAEVSHFTEFAIIAEPETASAPASALPPVFEPVPPPPASVLAPAAEPTPSPAPTPLPTPAPAPESSPAPAPSAPPEALNLGLIAGIAASIIVIGLLILIWRRQSN